MYCGINYDNNQTCNIKPYKTVYVFDVFEKDCTQKYAGTMNHNLDMMYFIDTKGISLVIVVNIIQVNIA